MTAIQIGKYVTFIANDHFHYRGQVVSIDRTRSDVAAPQDERR